MQELLIATALFTGIIAMLAVLIMLAQAFLVPSGEVTINVNGKRDLAVPAGGKLLGVLISNDLFLPSACGGGGTCGQCRVTVLAGGGSGLLPTEVTHISRSQAAAGERLACQVNVLEDMRIEVPEAVFGVNRWECVVRSNRNVATFIKELVLELPAGESIRFEAGGYVQIDCPPYDLAFTDIDLPPAHRQEWERYGLLDMESHVSGSHTRAYSMASYPEENDIIMLNVRIATPPPAAPPGTPPGIVSSYLFGLKPGDRVLVSGAYGEFHARDTDAEMIFIGGGAGMAPMRSLILDQLQRVHTTRRMSFWYGARSRGEAFYVEQFDALAAQHENFEWHLALSEPREEDQWRGPVGFIHEVLLNNYLREHPAPEDCEYYLCGPPMMNAAVLAMLDEQGVDPESIFLDDFEG